MKQIVLRRNPLPVQINQPRRTERYYSRKTMIGLGRNTTRKCSKIRNEKSRLYRVWHIITQTTQT